MLSHGSPPDRGTASYAASGKAKSRPTLLFVSNLFPDAASPYLGLDNATVLHALEKLHGWRVRVICPRPTLSLTRFSRTNGGWTPREQDAVWQPGYVPTPYVPKFGSRFNHRLMASAIRRKMHAIKNECDVVLASWLYPDAWAAARIADEWSKPSLLITQGSDTHQYLSDPVRRRAILEAILRSRGVITRSRDLATKLAQAGADGAKLHPIYNGVDTGVFRPFDKKEARDSLRVPQNATVLLFVGNLLPVKNPVLLVEAFARFQAERKNAFLVLVGKGPMRIELEQKARALGIVESIRFTGGLDAQQIAQWMNAADWLCLSSRNEGLPNVLLESFACGLPVLSTNVGGIHELLNTDTLGRLTAEGDLPRYLEALHVMSSQIWNRQTIANYGTQFSWGNCAAAYDALLRAALR